MEVLVLFIHGETIKILGVAGYVCHFWCSMLGDGGLPESVMFSFFVLGLWRRIEGSKANM